MSPLRLVKRSQVDRQLTANADIGYLHQFYPANDLSFKDRTTGSIQRSKGTSHAIEDGLGADANEGVAGSRYLGSLLVATCLQRRSSGISGAGNSVAAYFDLTGKAAIVTGSSRGIGKAVAEALAAHGANVVISSRNQTACDGVAEAINARGVGRAVAIAASVGSKQDLERLVAYARAEIGHVGVLICNAASNPFYGSMADISDEQFEKTLRNNVLANHWLSRLVLPEMIERREGVIIFISSIGGFRGSPVIGAYNISKAADFQLARNLAVEYGASNVRVNCIAPGLVRTDFAKALWEDPDTLARALGGTPLGRIGEPEDIAGAAVFLASRAGCYVTGETLVIDGGATITATGL